MEELIITTTIGTLAFLSHRHYEFYKRLSDYIWVAIVVGIITYSAYYFAIDSIEKDILKNIDEINNKDLSEIIKKYQGNSWIVISWILGLGIVNYVLTMYPLWVKSHPYNKTKNN